MSKYDQFDTETLIEMAIAEVHRLNSIWTQAMSQIDERKELQYDLAA